MTDCQNQGLIDLKNTGIYQKGSNMYNENYYN